MMNVYDGSVDNVELLYYREPIAYWYEVRDQRLQTLSYPSTLTSQG